MTSTTAGQSNTSRAAAQTAICVEYSGTTCRTRLRSVAGFWKVSWSSKKSWCAWCSEPTKRNGPKLDLRQRCSK